MELDLEIPNRNSGVTVAEKFLNELHPFDQKILNRNTEPPKELNSPPALPPLPSTEPVENKLRSKLNDDRLTCSSLLSANARPAENPTAEFGRALVYSALQSPIAGVAQLVDKACGTSLESRLTFINRPAHAESFSKRWHAQQLGSLIGMTVPFLLTHKLVGGGGNLFLGKLEKDASTRLLTTRLVGESMITGALFDGVLRPVEPEREGSFLKTRISNALVGATTLGVLTGSSIGIQSLVRGRTGALASVLRSDVGSSVLAGAPAGFVNAELNAISHKGRIATGSEVVEGIYTFSVLGGSLATGKHVLGKTFTEKSFSTRLTEGTQTGGERGTGNPSERTTASVQLSESVAQRQLPSVTEPLTETARITGTSAESTVLKPALVVEKSPASRPVSESARLEPGRSPESTSKGTPKDTASERLEGPSLRREKLSPGKWSREKAEARWEKDIEKADEAIAKTPAEKEWDRTSADSHGGKVIEKDGITFRRNPEGEVEVELSDSTVTYDNTHVTIKRTDDTWININERGDIYAERTKDATIDYDSTGAGASIESTTHGRVEIFDYRDGADSAVSREAAYRLKSQGKQTVIEYDTDGTRTTTKPDTTTIELRPDGTSITTKPDQTTIECRPDGTRIKVTPDETVITRSPDGTTTIEKPDGRVATRHPDGTIERSRKPRPDYFDDYPDYDDGGISEDRDPARLTDRSEETGASDAKDLVLDPFAWRHLFPISPKKGE